MDSSYATYGSWARLRSRLFSPTDHAELQYSYYMSGKSVNALKIYIVVNGFKNLLHAYVGDQGDDWLADNLDIRSHFPYRVSNCCLPTIGVNFNLSRLIHEQSLCILLAATVRVDVNYYSDAVSEA